MRHFWILGFALFILAGCFDGVTDKPLPVNPPWALGGLHVTGTLVNWDLGHAVPPTAEVIDGFMFLGEDDLERVGVAWGTVQEDGSFDFRGMCPVLGQNCEKPASEALCGGLSVSDSRLRMAVIDSIEIDGLEVGDAGPPPRPYGWVIISTERPRNFEILYHGRTYTYIYADRDATVKGSCDFSGPVDLDLRKGWNSVERNPKAGGYTTAAIPAEAKWWFLNPYTMVE
jgi:hypothetical protein